jgi:hypothetical protein
MEKPKFEKISDLIDFCEQQQLDAVAVEQLIRAENGALGPLVENKPASQWRYYDEEIGAALLFMRGHGVYTENRRIQPSINRLNEYLKGKGAPPKL